MWCMRSRPVPAHLTFLASKDKDLSLILLLPHLVSFIIHWSATRRKTVLQGHTAFCHWDTVSLYVHLVACVAVSCLWKTNKNSVTNIVTNTKCCCNAAFMSEECSNEHVFVLQSLIKGAIQLALGLSCCPCYIILKELHVCALNVTFVMLQTNETWGK